MDIHAAVVRSFDQPPRYEAFDLPPPADEDQAVVDVLAVGLHPRVRTGASGGHYTSTGKLPMVPGVDGVGRRADGRLVYFVADDDLVGPMATRTVIDTRRSVAAARRRRRGEDRRGDEPGHVGLGGAAPPGPDRARAVGAGPRRHRQRRADGHPGRQAARRRPGGRRRPRPGPAGHAAGTRRRRDGRAHRRRRRHRGRAGEGGRRGRPGHRLPVGRARRRRDHGAAAGPRRPQPRAGLDPDRLHGRPDHRTAVGGAALGQLPAPGQRSGRGLHPGVPGGAAVANRRDRQRRHRGHRPAGAPRRRRDRLDRARGSRAYAPSACADLPTGGGRPVPRRGW